MLGITAPDAGFVGAFALLGLLIGSFLNVLVHRLPRMMERQWRAEVATAIPADSQPLTPSRPHEPALSLLSPRSHCPHCGHVLRWHENIPLLSYLVLRGRCSACHGAIGARYPLVELGTALLFAWCAARAGSTQLPTALAWCGFCAVLLALALIDRDTTLLPDSLTQPLLWAGLGGAALGWTGTALVDAFWGAAIGYLSLWLLATSFHWATGREGMGHGDFKLLAALGAWLGWAALPPLLLLASSLGALVGLVLLGRQRRASARATDEEPEKEAPLYIPFGPFLAFAGLALLALGHGVFFAALGLNLGDFGPVLK
ncbi:prepilin peptidase [Hylemonella gracilis]|jgi:leader peptidase (prepilin peptidase)/N-methyltransferase|uniref:Prepilin leader peptidase/N-methyltransferase n=1 Tax=Hylemonella gracilis TaxID=80880 RepID=A0A4V1A217_9BURK|nr:prepilin peptidase [Hylemonella gracilis]QBK04489.1 prepilin peptidase [Hylemonella gracilis]